MTVCFCVDGWRNDAILFGHSKVFLLEGDDTPGEGTTFGNPGIEDTLPVDALRPALGLPKSSGHSEDDSLDSENRLGLNDRLATLLVTYCCIELKKLILHETRDFYSGMLL